ncbi:MAG TPA: hypothetical protein VEO54_18815 [Thermoanaerobaculia bacterium]|nr:hypothetical protein [Thermoanaerobaculia bacterium]
MRSIRSSSRARRSSERGYALISALVLAILYFAMVELLLIDSARELEAARRFRARIVAETLAENGVELAAVRLVLNERAEGTVEDWQGKVTARMAKQPGGQFDIVSEAHATGVTESKAKVLVRGRVLGGDVKIQYTVHTY